MKNDKYYLNRERFESEMKRHEGETHSRIKYNGHYAKLDKEVDLAHIIGVTRSTLSNYKTNKYSIPLENLQALSRQFKCDWEYLCGKQEYRSRREYMLSAIRKASDDLQRAHENGEPWFEYLDFEDSHTVTCNKYPVDRLIREIVQLGGYELIIDGLKGISEYIKVK